MTQIAVATSAWRRRYSWWCLTIRRWGSRACRLFARYWRETGTRVGSTSTSWWSRQTAGLVRAVTSCRWRVSACLACATWMIVPGVLAVATGWNFEHAPADGTSTMRLVKSSYDFSLSAGMDESLGAVAQPDVVPEPQAVNFALDSELLAEAEAAKRDLFDFAASVDIDALHYSKFGRSHIKTLGVSPDSFAQMAMQLAYFMTRGHLVPTYESMSMRRFLHGRTETVRPACVLFHGAVLVVVDHAVSRSGRMPEMTFWSL